LFNSAVISGTDIRPLLVSVEHAILLIVGHNQRHEFGSIAESWGDVLRRVRQYIGGKWTINQCIIMHGVYMGHLNHEECTVRSLAEAEDMPQQTVSNAVAALRADGLIDEKVHPDDGRIKLLSPTKLAIDRRNHWWSEAVGIE
jgi:DNA-binding transcriptional ArsR family regulator